MIAVDDDEGEVAFELGVGRAHRLGEIALVVALDEVGDHLGVGLGGERVPLGGEGVAQLPEVLDDAVQDDGDLGGGAAGQRMGVLVGDLAVRRPARVADPGRREGPVRPGGLLQLVEVADRPNVLEPVRLQEAEPSRVIAPVLESFQPLEQKILGSPRAYVSDDSAHPKTPFRPLAGASPTVSLFDVLLERDAFPKNRVEKTRARLMSSSRAPS